MMWACDSNLTTTIANEGVMGPLFTQALQSIIAAQCALAGDHLWPPDRTEAVLEDPNFDFIIIGAGSAGSVLANRLSEVPEWRILLVEAGGNPTVGTETPLLFYNNMKTSVDWQYITQPQKGNCRNYEFKGCAWPRGKVLGGSSSINGMFYARGNKLDYDRWAAQGNKGWSYDEVLPYFIKSENFRGKLTREATKYHGVKGYITVEEASETNDFEKILLDAGNELGLKTLDVNGACQMGIMRAHTTIDNGKRESVARAFLSPIKDRKNLIVMKNTLASKILFKDNSSIVCGITLHKDGKALVANIKKELVLSAGAINTPQLMLLSGLGPKKHLEDLNIKVKADLHVGENLQDHLFVPIFYSMPGDSSINSLANISIGFASYFLNKTSLLSDITPNKVIGFFNTTNSTSTSPDSQLHFIVSPPSFINMIDVFEKHSLSHEFRNKFNHVNKDKYILNIHTVLLQPKSKGRILLKSKNIIDHPLIYPNYFNHPEDLKTIIEAMKFSMKFGNTKAFKSAGLELQWIEIDACKNYNKTSNIFLECIARELTFSVYHPSCTVKMGPTSDKTAVVSPKLKVKNVKRLRVVDGSIMPSIISANTNAPIIMIAEKAADMIKKDWPLKPVKN